MSKRSLRPDPNFDLLISKIYPSRDEYEAHQERVLAKLNKSHSQAALVNSITEGIKLQSQNRPQRSRKNANEPENVNNASYASGISAPATPNPLNQSDSSQGPTGLMNNNSQNNLQPNSWFHFILLLPCRHYYIFRVLLCRIICCLKKLYSFLFHFPNICTMCETLSTFRRSIEKFHDAVTKPGESIAKTCEASKEWAKFRQ